MTAAVTFCDAMDEGASIDVLDKLAAETAREHGKTKKEQEELFQYWVFTQDYATSQMCPRHRRAFEDSLHPNFPVTHNRVSI